MDLHIYQRLCFLRGDSTMEIMRILKPSMKWWRICSWYMILSSTQWFLHVWTNWNIQPAFQDLRLFASFCVHKPNSSKISKLFRVQALIPLSIWVSLLVYHVYFSLKRTILQCKCRQARHQPKVYIKWLPAPTKAMDRFFLKHHRPCSQRGLDEQLLPTSRVSRVVRLTWIPAVTALGCLGQLETQPGITQPWNAAEWNHQIRELGSCDIYNPKSIGEWGWIFLACYAG